MSKKSKLVGCILLQMVNIDISITVIYDIFDIHKLTGLQVVFFFLFYGKFFFRFFRVSFFIYDRLFVIYDRFSNTSCKF